MNTQVNISIPSEWKDELERLARIFSVEEETTLTYLDLIRRAIKEKYDLSEEEDDASLNPDPSRSSIKGTGLPRGDHKHILVPFSGEQLTETDPNG